MKTYINLSLSILSLLFCFGLWYVLFFSDIQVSQSLSTITLLIPVFDILSIYFAVRSMKRNESNIGTYVGIAGILMFLVILYNVIFSIGFGFAGL